MEKTLPLEERSIYQIYMDGREPMMYQIPIYQRNYAWEDDEITALIKDVHDSFNKDKNAPYYIGTLVTYKRGDFEFEVIDGQQRLTTIYLILKAMNIDGLSNKLTYSARKVSAETIKNLPNFGEEVDWSIKNGFSYAQKAINAIVSENELKEFEQYFLHNVRIIHYSVPKDVDLNHYFEVMNSRGEQLEKHEIVKSNIGQYLKDTVELATFSRIWEACSEMNVYIQHAFPDTTVFGNNLDNFTIKKFDDIPKQEPSDGKDTILNFLHKTIEKMDENINLVQNETFQPIIDFPNFLLIVLKLTLLKKEGAGFKYLDFSLDDKELLNEYAKALNNISDKESFAKLFGFNLLKAKYLLDNFMVHHVASTKEQAGDNPWQLQCYYQEKKNKKYLRNLSSDIYIQQELVQLLSMFEVSFSAKQRKNYLFYCLVHLFDDRDINDYLLFLQGLAKKYFYNVYLNKDCLTERNQPAPNAFDNAIIQDGNLNVNSITIGNSEIFENIYRQGSSNIPLFVFNYTDYRLWKMYAEVLKGNKTRKDDASRKLFFGKLGCSDFELDTFKNFYFSRTRKSLEHYYPQSKSVKDENASECALGISQINCFGNFAMIGAEANSSGSNWDPKTKLDHYIDSKSDPVSVASLKFKIMMQMCQDNQKAMLSGVIDRAKGMEWNYNDIQIHQKNMLSILFCEY